MVEVPKSAVMTRIAGTNHPQTSPPIAVPTEPASSGPNNARNTSGWIIPKISENGSCRTGRSSRTHDDADVAGEVRRALVAATGAVSVAVLMRRSFREVAVLAEAAAGEGEEDVVEGGAVHLRRSRRARRRPAPRRAAPGSARGPSATPSLDPAALDGHVPGLGGRHVPCEQSPRQRREAFRRRRGDHDPVAREVGLEPVGRVVGDDPTVVDDHDPLGHRVGLVHVVRGQHDGHRVLGPHAQDVVPEVGAVLRVEAGGGLVEEQDRRRVHQPDRDVQPPPLPPGQARHLAVGQGREVERVEQFVGAPACGAPVEPEHGALRAQLVADALVVARAVALADVADACAAPRRPRPRRRARRPRPVPAVGAIRVVSMRMVVDLPAPFGPSTATSSPGAMSRSSACTACTVRSPRAKSLVSPRVRIAVIPRTLRPHAATFCPL